MNYELKYLKYKHKYNEFKKKIQSGGGSVSTELDIKKLFILYLDYFKKKLENQNTSEYIINSLEDSIVRFIQNKKDLSDYGSIQIDYPIDEIINNYNKYGIIILRDPTKSNKLLIGCGNNPYPTSVTPGVHAHDGFVTINLDISTNPTIIGTIGVDVGIIDFLKSKNHKYNVLATEAVSLGGRESLKKNEIFVKTIENILTDKFTYLEIDHSNTISQSVENLDSTSIFEAGHDIDLFID